MDSYLKRRINQTLNYWENEDEENEEPTNSTRADESEDESEDKGSFVSPPTDVHERDESIVEINFPADINEPPEEWFIFPVTADNEEAVRSYQQRMQMLGIPVHSFHLTEAQNYEVEDE